VRWCVVGEGGVETSGRGRGREVWGEDIELLLARRRRFDFWLVLDVTVRMGGVEEL